MAPKSGTMLHQFGTSASSMAAIKELIFIAFYISQHGLINVEKEAFPGLIISGTYNISQF
jgi:hypothetical protein